MEKIINFDCQVFTTTIKIVTSNVCKSSKMSSICFIFKDNQSLTPGTGNYAWSVHKLWFNLSFDYFDSLKVILHCSHKRLSIFWVRLIQSERKNISEMITNQQQSQMMQLLFLKCINSQINLSPAYSHYFHIINTINNER